VFELYKVFHSSKKKNILTKYLKSQVQLILFLELSQGVQQVCLQEPGESGIENLLQSGRRG
jgi:di/tripeptidase